MRIITILNSDYGNVYIRSVPIEYEDDENEAFNYFCKEFNFKDYDCQYLVSEGLNMDLSI